MSTALRRAIKRASVAYARGRPYDAVEILRRAGCPDEVTRSVLRACQHNARRRYVARIKRYTPPDPEQS